MKCVNERTWRSKTERKCYLHHRKGREREQLLHCREADVIANCLKAGALAYEYALQSLQMQPELAGGILQ